MLEARIRIGIVAVLGMVVPAAVFIYALTFTLLDLINEVLGKDGARRVIYAAIAANLLLAAYVQLAVALPPADFYQGQDAFAGVLGATPRIVLASLTAYLISSLIDAEVFAWWKQRVGRFRWTRVLVSNAVSTLVDSALFVSLAFWGILPVLPLIQGQYAVKMAVTIVSIPLIYLVKEGWFKGRAEGALARTG
ncbi:MAG: queuosine precursor transporter [Dehalococcoidia bacterium]|nr:queuosine precursor transporter [Dehalococcoidia bacterium]